MTAHILRSVLIVNAGVIATHTAERSVSLSLMISHGAARRLIELRQRPHPPPRKRTRNPERRRRLLTPAIANCYLNNTCLTKQWPAQFFWDYPKGLGRGKVAGYGDNERVGRQHLGVLLQGGACAEYRAGAGVDGGQGVQNGGAVV